MAQWNMLYDMYERRLKAELSDAAVPAHIGVILDGNRRWAKSLGATASQGHRAGAGKISEFLQWSDDAGVSIVTLWLLSTDNLSRDAGELGELLSIICEAVSLLADQGRWKLAVVGDLSLLPEQVAEDLRASVARTADVQGMTVNIAVGYGGRHEITEAVRSMMREASAQGRTLDELADSFTDADITARVHEGPARPRPRHPNVGRAAPVGLHAVAVRALRVLLLRGLLARLPPRRFPASPALLRAARAPHGQVTARRACRALDERGRLPMWGPASSRVWRA